MSGIQITQVRSETYGATVEFSDGHSAGFEAYYHDFGYSIEGLRSFELYKGDKKVFAYNSRLYRVGPQPDEHKVAFMAEGYTQQRVAGYWQAARDYLNREYLEKEERPKNLWWSWRVICAEGGSDLEELEKGIAEIVEEQHSRRDSSSRDIGTEMGAFGALVSALGGGGNTGNLFPQSDSDDFLNGARFIPGEVTLARRRGEKVQFMQPTAYQSDWYWEMPDGTHIQHG